MTAREKLIVGLDVPTVHQAEDIVSKIGDEVLFYKIGYQLVFAGGLEFARDLVQSGKKVFLDMKLLDIDNTVASGVENIARMGMSMLTSARSRPRTTAVAKGIMSSTVQSSTSSWPKTFLPRLSPTDKRSTPARSQIFVIWYS